MPLWLVKCKGLCKDFSRVNRKKSPVRCPVCTGQEIEIYKAVEYVQNDARVVGSASKAGKAAIKRR